ncbi:MAG TPA: carboxymuconolactone decarboxylase family protein [Gammaproteobacteria bacterium]|nr:carboxymuconolactone decarboxylase family protein [Gammaproteobacteria bacterium]
MQPRLDARTAAPELLKAPIAFDTMVHDSGLDIALLELVKIRASQLNGCAYCVHRHTFDARRHGESEQRLHLLSVWREEGRSS